MVGLGGLEGLLQPRWFYIWIPVEPMPPAGDKPWRFMAPFNLDFLRRSYTKAPPVHLADLSTCLWAVAMGHCGEGTASQFPFPCLPNVTANYHSRDNWWRSRMGSMNLQCCGIFLEESKDQQCPRWCCCYCYYYYCCNSFQTLQNKLWTALLLHRLKDKVIFPKA